MLINEKNVNWFLACLILFSASIGYLFLEQLKATPLYTQILIDERGYSEKALGILKEGWIGDSVFYQAPLYPYFVALVYKIFGFSLDAVRYLQTFFYLITLLIIYKTTALLFDRKTGVVSVFMASLYGIFVLYNGLILKVTLSTFFTSLMLLALVQTCLKFTSRQIFVSGLLLGLNITLRGNYLLLMPGLLVWVYLLSASREEKIRHSLFFTLGVMLILAPMTIRNYALEKDFVLTTYQAGANFFIGNNAASKGTYTPLPYVRANPEFEETDFRKKAEETVGHPMYPSEISRFWFKKTLKNFKDDPAFYLNLFFKKFLLLFNAYEIPDNHSLYLSKKLIPVLNICFFSYGVVLMCSLLGMGLNEKWKEKRFWPFYVFIFFYSLSLVLFFVTARYRVPLVPALLPFSAYFLTEGWKKAIALKNKKALAAVIFLLLYIINRPSGIDLEAQTNFNVGSSYSLNGQYDEAIYYLKRALEFKSDFPHAHNNIGIAYEKKGEMEKARKHYKLALEIEPGFVDAAFNMGQLLKKQGHVEEAVKYFRSVLKMDGKYAKAYYAMGNVLYNSGDLKKALKHFQRAVKFRPDYAEAYFHIGTILYETGDVEGAIKSFSNVLRITPDDLQIHFNMGYIFLETKRPFRAIPHFEKVTRLDPENATAFYNLGLSLRKIGKVKEGEQAMGRALLINPRLIRRR